ncbi:MAG: HEPN domain-containing protein [Burkholderiaceae bacterium]|nr:MAG: HEPN domain-containing protein [Burkholderiaceae bacterium]
MTPAKYIEKSERASQSARLLLEAGDIDGACNRAYYSMHDAAQAALLALGHADYNATKTHRGLIAAFGLHVIQTNKLPRELGRALNEVEQVRLLADYTGDAIKPEQAAWAVEQAVVFVAAVSALLKNSDKLPAE